MDVDRKRDVDERPAGADPAEPFAIGSAEPKMPQQPDLDQDLERDPEPETALPNVYQRAIEAVIDNFGQWGEGGEMLSLAECGLLDDPRGLAAAIEACLDRESAALAPLRSHAASLRLASDCAALLAVLVGGADPVAVVAAWGSLRFLLHAAASASDSVRDLAFIVEELSLALPRLQAFEEILPGASPRLEALLEGLYRESLTFLARSLRFVRGHRRILLRRASWDRLRAEGTQVLRNVRHWSSAAEVEGQVGCALRAADRHDDVMGSLEMLRAGPLTTGAGGVQEEPEQDARESYYFVPSLLSPRFYGRKDALKAIETALRYPDAEAHVLKSFVLYGIGGVGKTQIALRYAQLHRQRYEAILWVDARTVVTAGDCFREIARFMNLLSSELEAQNTAYLTLRVKNWLADSGRPWLLIFDGADDLNVLQDLWPANAKGHILLTTRDQTGSHAHGVAQSSFHVRSFDAYTGGDFLLDSMGMQATTGGTVTTTGAASGGNNIEQLQYVARQISHRFGGLPLALSQVAGFLTERRLNAFHFLALYKSNEAGIDAIRSATTNSSGYGHTIATVWQTTLARLEGDFLTLLGILAHLDPDGVTEEVLVRGAPLLGRDSGCEFMQDEMRLAGTQEVLLRTGMIFKDAGTGIVSMHPLIQRAVIRNQSDADKQHFFDLAARLLRPGFPDRWTRDKGHQYRLHGRSAKYLPHVYRLIEARRQMASATAGGVVVPAGGDVQGYGEVLLGASWYLFELERLSEAQTMVRTTLAALHDEAPSLAYASALDLTGLIDLDLNSPATALQLFEHALDIRRRLPSILTASSPLIGLSHTNIGRALTNMGRLPEAQRQLGQGLRIRQLGDDVRDPECSVEEADGRVGNSYSNLAACLLRQGKAEEAEAALGRCPALAGPGGMSDDSFVRDGNPRFLGDMVLLGRVRLAQGRADSALWLASCALAYRRRTLGACLKTADAAYDVVRLMLLHGNHATALELAQELEKMARTIPALEGKGQRARVLYKMAVIHDKTKRVDEARQCREMAETLRAEIRPDLARAPFNEEEFDKLCPWMLW